MLSVEYGDKQLTISTHRGQINVHVFKNGNAGRLKGQQLAYWEFTFDQLCTLFEQLRPGIHESLTR